METKNITLPESWDEITINQFQELISLNEEQLEGVKKAIEVISIITNTDTVEVKKMPISVINQIDKELKWLLDKPTMKFKKEFIVDGVEYGILPSLNQLSIGEMIDLEQFAEGGINTIHDFVSVLYRPIIKRSKLSYEIEEYDSIKASERAEIFRDKLPISYIFGVSVFFSLIGIVLLDSSKVYSQEVLQGIVMEMMN